MYNEKQCAVALAPALNLDRTSDITQFLSALYIISVHRAEFIPQRVLDTTPAAREQLNNSKLTYKRARVSISGIETKGFRLG